MEKRTIKLDVNGIAEALDFVSETLRKYGQKEKIIYETMLLTEESMVDLMQAAPENSVVQISIRRNIGIATVRLVAPGELMEAGKNVSIDLDMEMEAMESEAESAIRNILLRSYAEKLKYSHKNGYNTIKIIAGMVESQLAALTMISLIAAIVCGIGLKFFVGAETVTMIDDVVFVPIEKMFINVLQLVTAPTVFCSIVCCVAQFNEFRDPGRVSIKVFIGYILTTIAAVFIGIKVFEWLKPGIPGIFASWVNTDLANQGASGAISVLDTIISMVPSNIIEPFYTTNSVQLVFMALICGIAVGMVEKFSETIRNFFEAFNALFSKIISLAMNFMPLAVFASTVSILLHVGVEALISLGQLILVVLVGFVVIMVMYILLILVGGRLNPFYFLKKYLPEMKNTFILGSGIAALPDTIQFCKNKMGISPKVYSFSIPLGAITNLDGNCVYLSIAGLFLARLCGIELFSSEMMSMIFAIIILSIGAPITPGSALLCLFVLLTQMGVSLEVISLIMGINFFIEMILGMFNTMGDVAIALIIARSEKLMDMDIYKRKFSNNINL